MADPESGKLPNKNNNENTTQAAESLRETNNREQTQVSGNTPQLSKLSLDIKTSTKHAAIENIATTKDDIKMKYLKAGIDPVIIAPTPFTDPTPELTRFVVKLGWVQGVLIPCLLNIWGVMLFLRIAWIVAQAGIGLTILIILMASVVCVITTLSLSAICTNGQLQGGGVYFLVSRSLGAELGASVGIIFAFANAVAASMNTIGFCDSLNELLKAHSMKIFDNSVNDTRIVGTIALLVLCLICAFGMDWETKTQNFLIVIIVTAIINYIIGAAMGPTSDRERAEGFVGISMELAKENWQPDFRYSEGEHHTFITVFAVYFPAVTGVQAGANICGDLRDPATAIPKGTLLALAISVTSYLAMAVLSGMGALRDASGQLQYANNPSALAECKPTCYYGLHNNYEIMQLMALWGPLIYGGCWAATLSTALTNLLSVPRLVQALGVDRIYPGLIFFSKPYGRYGEPYRGYVLVFLISASFLLIADLNRIAPLITNFYLASYALINFCTFHASYIRPLSWRPSFRYYNQWLSLAGCIMCVIVMVVISWVMALTTTFIFLFLYLIVVYRKPDTNWGGSAEAQRYQEIVERIRIMTQQSFKKQAFNPQVLVLAGEPFKREWLLDMGKLITSVGSFMISADICTAKLTSTERLNLIEMAEKRLHELKLPAFFMLVDNFDYAEGLKALLQCAGLGRLTPNIVLIGYMYNWQRSTKHNISAYYKWIQLAYEYGVAVAVLRVPISFRSSRCNVNSPTLPTSETDATGVESGSETNLETPTVRIIVPEDSDMDYNAPKKGYMPSKELNTTTPDVSPVKTGGYRNLIFHENNILDAWWLYDDGGLNILLPYIIAKRGSTEKIILRVLILNVGAKDNQYYYDHMKDLLKNLRIQYSDIILVDGINETPSPSTWTMFKTLIEKHRTEQPSDPYFISEADYEKQLKKTTRYLRLRELVIQNSIGADFIVMTLPLPRKESLPAALYMAWLEMMSNDLPPMMFVRGTKPVLEMHNY